MVRSMRFSVRKTIYIDEQEPKCFLLSWFVLAQQLLNVCLISPQTFVVSLSFVTVRRERE